jgi:hypothetical protein
MSAVALLSRLQDAGVTIAADGDNIRLWGPKAALGDALITELRAHKAELLDLLRTPARSSEAIIAEWRAAIAGVSTDLLEVSKLKTVSLRLLDGPNVAAAIENEWNEVSLFGIHGGRYPKERLDSWGLTALLAWGTHSYTIEDFSRDVCTLRTRSGSVLRQPRMRANFDHAVPWWTHPAFG